MDDTQSPLNKACNSQQESQQQFCLKWHNHQISLLSTLPVLLDQSHLTDVTISAEGRSVQAHRIVLSACSSFFSDLFRTLDAKNHPVIIIPGTTFTIVVALVTFMYSGEVNVFEDQIPILLNLAETLGIKGLAEFHENIQKVRRSSEQEYKDKQPLATMPTVSRQSSCPKSPHESEIIDSSFPMTFPYLNNYIPFEYLKSLQVYTQPLHYTEEKVDPSSDLLQSYQKCNGHIDTDLLSLFKKKEYPYCKIGDLVEARQFCYDKETEIVDEINENKVANTDKIDKIMETLRLNKNKFYPPDNACYNSYHTSVKNKTSLSMSSIDFTHSVAQPTSNQNMFSYVKVTKGCDKSRSHNPNSVHEEYKKSPEMIKDKLNININSPTNTDGHSDIDNDPAIRNKKNDISMTSQPKQPCHSKLYATCLICHKQLSNQYNLRVHMETHQNVRYSCGVCSHVSRSKDALRKHISYRHPSTQVIGENESRKKRSFKPYPNIVLPFIPNSQRDVSGGSAINCISSGNLKIDASEVSSNYIMISKKFNIETSSVLSKKHIKQKLSEGKREENTSSGSSSAIRETVMVPSYNSNKTDICGGSDASNSEDATLSIIEDQSLNQEKVDQ